MKEKPLYIGKCCSDGSESAHKGMFGDSGNRENIRFLNIRIKVFVLSHVFQYRFV